MKKIDRNAKIDAIRSSVIDCFGRGKHTYYVLVDLRNGGIALSRRSPKAQYYIKICEVCTRMPLTNKNVKKVASQILKCIKDYNKTCLMCYSKAVSEYGKGHVVDEAFIKKVDNPHYKCAAPMKLYDKNVIEYHFKN